MTRKRRSILAAATLFALLAVGACADAAAEEEEVSGEATVEPIEGREVSRVTLTEAAAKRLDIQTEAIGTASGWFGTKIPYGAVLYDPSGDAWAFVRHGRLSFVREAIAVDHIDGDVAYLTDSPPAGTLVVKVGAPELYGSEIGVGDE